MAKKRTVMPDDMFNDCLKSWSNSVGGRPYWNDLAEKWAAELLSLTGKVDGEFLRGWFKGERKYRGIHNKGASYNYKTEFGKSKDGTYTSDRLIEIFEGDLNDDRKLLKAHNLDPDKWTIIDSISNMWHAQRIKDRGQLVQFQSKIRVKPKSVQDISLDDIREFYRKNEFAVAPVIKRKFMKPDVKRILEFDVADCHIGSRWYDKNWSDLEDLFPAMVDDILTQVGDTKFSEVWIVPLGDVFHYHNRKQQTERHGQTVDSNGMNPLEMYDFALSMFVETIEKFMNIAPVHMKYIPGNHDGDILYYLLSGLENRYKDEPNFSADLSHSSRKWQVFGENLIAWEHGEMPKRNQMHWLQTDAWEDWGKCRYREIHYGHLHHEEVLEHGGLKRRRLPSIAPTDFWHHRNGYNGSIRASMAFVWEENRIGFSQMWQSTGVLQET